MEHLHKLYSLRQRNVRAFQCRFQIENSFHIGGATTAQSSSKINENALAGGLGDARVPTRAYRPAHQLGARVSPTVIPGRACPSLAPKPRGFPLTPSFVPLEPGGHSMPPSYSPFRGRGLLGICYACLVTNLAAGGSSCKSLTGNPESNSL